MKIRPYLLRCNHPDGRRQQCIERSLKLAWGQFGLRLKVRDLPGRMNACVRSSSALNGQPVPREILQDIAQSALNRGLSGLHLPSAEISSVVRQSEFDVLHGRREQLSHAHGHSPPKTNSHFLFEFWNRRDGS
jgi:hypothetical protein